MDAKVGYNGFPAQQHRSWDQPQYGYSQQPQGYPQNYPQQPPMYQQHQYPQQQYSEQSQYPPQQQQQHHHSNFSNQIPSQPTTQIPRGYEVVFTSWSGRHMEVTEDTHDGPLAYSADLHTRKPHMIFKAEGTAHLPATVTFHSFSRTIDISINGEAFPLRTISKWKYEYAWDAQSLGGKKLIWKRPSCWNWKYMNIECSDESGTVYARFDSHKGWSGKKAGRMEILAPAAPGGKALVDEIMVTGLANVYLQLSSMMAANGSAAASSAGVAAAVS
ncbi:hypothetical protein BJY04DRAFT_199245 [Aspergillus karnatakaensis]|uniref:uncharacterized protein n=1 Tax=Aspergillus karnatakaensis TaxID=1810916 RepID=UPI003CCD3FFC